MTPPSPPAPTTDRQWKAGFGFHEIAPNLDPADRELIDAVLDMGNGPERLHKKAV